MKQFHVYILASLSKCLYVGVTNNLKRRVWEHRQGVYGFTARYRIKRLVHFEQTISSISAIQREKQIKGWLRQKKIELIEEHNPMWLDLAENWFDLLS